MTAQMPEGIATRLVNELMLVSVLVAGEGAPTLAAELEAEGSAAEVFAGGQATQGFDLAILLADPASAAGPVARQLVQTLSQASERLLFAPLPLGANDSAGTPALPQLAEWFEVFADFGYQPVVEFDASFVSPGAFLVDRAATAAESELAAFADRLQRGAGTPNVDTIPAATLASSTPSMEIESGLRARLAEAEAALAEARNMLAARQAEIDGLLVEAGRAAERADAARQSAQSLEDANAGWDNLRRWARALVTAPGRDTPKNLARDLPRLNAWRAPAPPITLPPPLTLRVFGRRLPAWPRTSPTPAILADTALVRASRLFDAAWYVAATPELADNAAVDPVFHYVLVGAPRGADPGPWFDTAGYLAEHPEVAGTGLCPLVHAIRTKADEAINSG